MQESTKLALILAILAFMGCARSAKERPAEAAEPVAVEGAHEKLDGAEGIDPDGETPKALTEEQERSFQSMVNEIDQLTRVGLSGKAGSAESPLAAEDLGKCALDSRYSGAGNPTIKTKFGGPACTIEFTFDSFASFPAKDAPPHFDHKLAVDFELKDPSKAKLVDITKFQTSFVSEAGTHGSTDLKDFAGKLTGEGKIVSRKNGEIAVSISGAVLLENGHTKQTTRIEFKYPDGLAVVLTDVYENGQGKCAMNGKSLSEEECGMTKGKLNLNPIFSTGWTKGPVRPLGPITKTPPPPIEE